MRTRAEGKILRDTYLAYKDGKLIEPEDRSALDALADAHLVEYFYTRDGIVARAVRFRGLWMSRSGEAVASIRNTLFYEHCILQPDFVN